MKIKKENYDYKITAAGRINIIGEHIDYCGGNVFPAALSLCNTVYIKANNTNQINISWTTLPNSVTLDINDLISAKNLKYGNYQAGCAYFYKMAGYKLLGCDMLFDCSIPFGSGLSSSAAIEVSTIAALATIANEKIDPVEIALIALKAEHEFALVNCGIMDQYASACGKKDHAMLIDCKKLTCTYAPINLNDYSIVIINSKKKHTLSDSKYNERREETTLALNILKEHLEISCLADINYNELIKYKELMPEIIFKRATHVVLECQRVKDAYNAMINNDLIGLGKLLTKSHESLRDLYEVTGLELDTLVNLALNHEACIGSRMTGGGFGGCTISIVKTNMIDSFKDYVLSNYKKSIGIDAECYEAYIADGITVEKL